MGCELKKMGSFGCDPGLIKSVSMEKQTIQNKLEKQTFHNREHIQEARDQHKAKIKQAIDLIESSPMDWKQKQKEYKRLSKIKFAYFKKSNSQIELEKSMSKVKEVMQATETLEETNNQVDLLPEIEPTNEKL